MIILHNKVVAKLYSIYGIKCVDIVDTTLEYFRFETLFVAVQMAQFKSDFWDILGA